jgi:hypothetical protein
MGVYSMEYLNQILFDCLWGTCSSSIRRPRVSQCTRKFAQATTLVICILYVPGSNFQVTTLVTCILYVPGSNFQVTTLVTCILYVPGSSFGPDADCHNRKLFQFCPLLPDVSSCRHDMGSFSVFHVLFFHISLFIVIQSFDIIC